MIKCYVKVDDKEYRVTGIDFKNQTIVYYNPDIIYELKSIPPTGDIEERMKYLTTPLIGVELRVEYHPKNVILNTNNLENFCRCFESYVKKAKLLGVWDYGEYNHHNLEVYADEELSVYYLDNVTDSEGIEIEVNGKLVNVIEMPKHLCPPKVK